MTELGGLSFQQRSQILQGLTGVDSAGRIVRRVQNDAHGLFRQHFLHSLQLDLEAGNIRRNYLEGSAHTLGKGLVLREIGSHSQNFAAGNGDGPQHSHQLRRSATADEQILRTDTGMVAVVQIVGNGLTGGKITDGRGVAVDGKGTGVIQNVTDGLIHLLGSRDGGVAQTVVKDIFPTHDGSAGAAVFKKIPDAGSVGA